MNNLISKMNKTQKYTLGLIFSIALFIIAYGIARDIAFHPFRDIHKTWLPWLVMTISLGFIWFKLLDDEN